MTPANLRVLTAEASSGNLPGLEEQKAHTDHRSPLAVVSDVNERRLRRRRSWARLSLTGLASRLSSSSLDDGDAGNMPRISKRPSLSRSKTGGLQPNAGDEADDEFYPVEESEKSISERVLYTGEQKQSELEVVMEEEKTKVLEASKARAGTRLTMTSRSGYFADRIITPAMVSLQIGCIHRFLDLTDEDRRRCVRWPSSILASRTLILKGITTSLQFLLHLPFLPSFRQS